MSVEPSLAELVERRRRLLQALGAGAGSSPVEALVFAGAPVSRNFPANAYPFRASSHFLYLVGASLPGAALLLHEGESVLFLEAPPEDDALWHGESPEPASLAETLGCRYRPFAALADAVGGRRVATIAAPDAATRALQIALLGREVAREPSADDVRLLDAMVALRLRHDDAAQRGLREAARVTALAHRAGMLATAGARHEREVRAAMEAELLRHDCEPAYRSIVTIHGEVLHQRGYDHAFEPGALLLADVGAETRGGYAGDVTRTWPVDGRFSPTQRAIYEVVLAAQASAIERVRPGVRFRDVHEAASRALAEGLVALGLFVGDVEEIVADRLHALFFPHGVGHLLGLDVHDMEDLGDRAGYAPGWQRSTEPGLRYLRLDRVLEPGMAVTIEPGFYSIPAFLRSELAARAGDRLHRPTLERFADVRGIRIEDDLLVTTGGHECLTAAIPKTIAAVEAVLDEGRR